MLPRVDVEAAVAFVQVVRHRSFRAAASKLGIPRSTLSQRVQRLEEQLGVQLLSRSTRVVRVTDVGERYLGQVLPALQALYFAEEAVQETKKKPTGRLRLTAPLELGQATMPDLLTTYTARYPDVELEVELTDRVVNLIEEGFDLAIRVGPLADSALSSRRLGKLPALGTFASPTYLNARGRPTTPEELKHHCCLAMSGVRQPKVWTYLVEGKRRHVVVQPKVSVNSFGVLRDLAIAGRGVVRLPISGVNSAVSKNLLTEVLSEFVLKPATCFAVFHGGPNPNVAVRSMLGVLTERFALAPWEDLFVIR